MSQLANVVINDRAATPVAHTFTPNSLVGNTAVFAESTGTPVSDPTLTVLWTKQSNGRRKVTVRLRKPIVQNETINGVVNPKEVRVGIGEVSFSFDPTSTEQERADVVGLLANSLSASLTVLNDTLVKNQGMF